MNTPNKQLDDKIDGLTRDFVASAREHGIEVHGINVVWIDGKFEARVQYLAHKPTIPAKDSYHGEPQTELG